jgi:hypothetical protein
VDDLVIDRDCDCDVWEKSLHEMSDDEFREFCVGSIRGEVDDEFNRIVRGVKFSYRPYRL